MEGDECVSGKVVVASSSEAVEASVGHLAETKMVKFQMGCIGWSIALSQRGRLLTPASWRTLSPPCAEQGGGCLTKAGTDGCPPERT